MDYLGIFYIILLLVIIVYSNFTFFKGIKNIEKPHLKHQLFYFLMSLIFPCSIVFIVAIIISSPALLRLMHLNIDFSSDKYRVVIGSIIFPSSILANISFAKFYLKRISKTKNKNEIELIGKE